MTIDYIVNPLTDIKTLILISENQAEFYQLKEISEKCGLEFNKNNIKFQIK